MTTYTITIRDERAACWRDDVVVTSAPADARPLVRDGAKRVTTSDPRTVAWARELGAAVEITEAAS